MQKERLDYLLERYSKNELSELEFIELEDWYHELNYNNHDLNSLIQEAGGPDLLADQFYKKFQNRTSKPYKARRFILIRSISSVAAVLICVIFALFFYLPGFKKEKVRPEKSRFSVIKSGGNKAILTLANGKTINLSDVSTGEVATQAGIRIIKTNDGNLVYKVSDSINTSTVISYNNITTPNGGKYQISLPDGSLVWLNSASSLKFPSLFAKNGVREVELNGEAYFEIKKDNTRPFIVVNNNQSVKVLGTHFNIKAYPNEPVIKTTLLEGSVLVNVLNSNHSKLLSPGQQSILNTNQLTIQDADIKEVLAWKNGYFMFKDEDIYSIMNQVARWYDVEIVYQDNFENKRFGGYISRSKKITDLLEIMERTRGINFRIEGRRVIVMK